MTGPDNDDRDELSRSLYLARRGAGLGQVEAAKRAGTSQNKVSRVENGKGLLTLAEAEALLTVYSVYGDERRRIMTLVEAAQAGHLDARVILQRGAHHFQERVRQLDEQSRLVRSFAPTVVLGILQTRAYAHVVFTQRMTEEQAAPSVTARVARHRMLDDSSRQWVLLQTEGALRWNLGGSALMVEQIEEITVAIDRPNVRLGIIPWRGVPDYEALFDQLARLAVFDDEARTMLGRITDDYRTL
ncbi:MAG: Scr1 family TA system antitoxin-like transcriptional regulator [Pseudonocardiales bacterium]